MSKFFSILVLLVAFSILGIVSFSSYQYVKEKNSLKFTPIPTPISATTSPSIVLFATSTIDMSNWKSYKNQELGYSIKYPEDLIINYDDSILLIAFPKENYFHWPLLDDVKLTVVATSSCLTDLSTGTSSVITINNRTYDIEKDFNDVAMGSVWKEKIYNIAGNGICYKLTTSIKGVNGAGFYVDNKSLIMKYDNQHNNDIAQVNSILWAILGSFEIINIPAGNIQS